MNDKVEILTPVGRLVSGDCFKANTKDANGNPLTVKSGANIGQLTQNYYIAIAIAKADVGYNELWAKIHGEAKRGFPQLFDPTGVCLQPAFAFKITDGDSQVPNSKNNKPCDREGWPGHWILHFSGSFAPKCYTTGGNEMIVDPNAIKRGYFIRIYGSVVANMNLQKPGVYLNHSMVELMAFGEEIKTGPDGAAIFGGTPAGALPAGASATPIATTPAIAAPGAAAAAPPAPGAAAAAPPAPGAAAAAPPAPAADYLNPKTYLVNGVQYTAEQLTASKWTAEQIAALG